jgi:hypothetical protein
MHSLKRTTRFNNPPQVMATLTAKHYSGSGKTSTTPKTARNKAGAQLLQPSARYVLVSTCRKRRVSEAKQYAMIGIL